MSETTPVPDGARRPSKTIQTRPSVAGAAPRPSRPPVSVAPMREPVSDERPRAVDIATGLWVVVVIGLAAVAALVGTRQTAVRMALRRSLTTEHPTTRASDIGSLVDIVLLVSAGIAAVIALLVIYGSLRLRRRLVSGRGVLTTMAALTVVGSVAFWDVIGPARGDLTAAVNVLPFAIAAVAAVAVAVTFAPDVGRWLRSAPLR